MRFSGALLAIAATTAILCAGGADAATASTPSAPALLARVSQPGDELGLLGQSSGSPAMSRKETASELRFTNRDGYRFTVVAFGQTVALSVANSRKDPSSRVAGRSSTTTYLAHGTSTPTSIRAAFGDRGRIALRFQPGGRTLRASRHAGCRRPSGRTIAQFGLFVGELRFRGEDGYTSAEIHRVHGGSIDLAALVSCRPGAGFPRRDGLSSMPAARSLSGTSSAHAAGSRSPSADSSSTGVPTHPSLGPKRTTLLASLKLPLSRTVFGARLRGEGPARFLAAEEASDGQVGIVRIATASAPKQDFAFDGTLANAVVAPPAPFSGSGVFQHGPGGEKSWTGSLAVSFLGAPRVPLTGSPFKAQLAQSW